jgi:Na+-transporting NADH:ubiquinone oxidoreductase subunit C
MSEEKNNNNIDNEDQRKVEKDEQNRLKDEDKKKQQTQDKAEKKRKKRRERLFTVFFMLIVTFVFISGLTVVNLFTQETIETNEEVRLQRSILRAAGVEDIPGSVEEIQVMFEDTSLEPEELSQPDNEGPIFVNGYYEVDTDRGAVYVFRVVGPGLWGEIELLIGFESDGETLAGLEVYQQSETPGLGARITEEPFKEQFRGKDIPEKDFDYVGEDVDDKDSHEFNGLTGASTTIRFLRRIINHTIDIAQRELQG